MRHARAVDNANPVSLFPFLAVLLCTMGALIVILVVLAQQARSQASEAANEPSSQATPESEEAAIAREMLAWEIEQMQSSRDQTAEDLERARLELSHREEHLRRMQEEVDRLAAAAKQLQESKQSTSLEKAEADAQLARMQEALAAAAARLEKAREEAKQDEPAYAIIPYEGPSGTHRRPIYIECRADAVVLQPEGIVLRSSDFQAPLGPGNPLAAALRAAREYLAARQPAGAKPQEPYPLLLVRPDGIAAYYKVREAIESWGPDFGYELISGDWQLSFPPADPQLAAVEHEAVRQGRIYQERLAMAAPSRYGRRQPVYAATPTRGGFVRIDGGAGEGEGDSFGEPGYGAGDSFAGGGGGTGQGGGAGAGRSSEPQHPSGAAGGGGQGEEFAFDGRGGAGGNRSSGAGTTSGGQGGSGASGREQQAQPGAGTAAEAGGAAGETAQNSASATFGAAAKRRGRNWALPDSGQASIPVSRPVRVICQHDQLIILVDNNLQKSKVVPVEGATHDAIDPLVAQLWEHMETWGIAGNGMYWRPVLILQPVPGGEGRAEDLRRLLQGSGLAIEEAVEGRQ